MCINDDLKNNNHINEVQFNILDKLSQICDNNLKSIDNETNQIINNDDN